MNSNESSYVEEIVTNIFTQLENNNPNEFNTGIFNTEIDSRIFSNFYKKIEESTEISLSENDNNSDIENENIPQNNAQNNS